MSRRKIIKIDEAKCNGCGNCVTSCAEGALRIIDGKARLIKEQYCDGFGNCLGDCPTGALTIEERDAAEYDEDATRAMLLVTEGQEAVTRFDAAAHPPTQGQRKPHSKTNPPPGCPGAKTQVDSRSDKRTATPVDQGAPRKVLPSELSQWPAQLHLVRPDAPFFKNRELVVLSTCSPVASADVHWRFIRGRAVVIACPKLDQTEGYVEKLAAILKEPSIPQVLVVRMTVPCCGGLTAITNRAIELSGRSDLKFKEVAVELNGDIPS